MTTATLDRNRKISRLKELEELKKLQKAKQIRLAKRDVNAFIEYCFTDTRRKVQVRQSLVHREFQTAIEQNEFVFGELPRDTGKTSQCVARVIFWLGNNPDELVKVISVSDQEAKKRIREISEHIRYNVKVHEIFPHLRPSNMSGWTQHAIYVQRTIVAKDASVEAYGLESSGIGGRATRLIFDDVVNPKSVRSQALREATKETFYGVWLPMVDEDEPEDAEPEPEEEPEVVAPAFEDLPDELPDRRPRGGEMDKKEKPPSAAPGGAKVVWIGTPWHTADLHCELKAKALEMGWFLFSRAVGGEWAREQATLRGEPADEYAPVWPELWGRKRLMKRAKRLPRIHFARAYWLQPMSDEDRVWQASDYRFCTWEEVSDIDLGGTVGAWDFQFSEKRSSDYNAYVAIALGPDIDPRYEGRDALYVFRAYHFRGGLQKTARNLIDWAARDGLHHVGLEDVQAQTWMRQYVNDVEGAMLPIRRMNPKKLGGDKVARALRTQPYVEQHRVYFLPGTEDLQAEMDDFPFGSHDDLVDAFVYAVLLIFEYYLKLGWDDEEEEAETTRAVYDDGAIRITSSGGLNAQLDDDDEGETPVSILDQVRFS